MRNRVPLVLLLAIGGSACGGGSSDQPLSIVLFAADAEVVEPGQTVTISAVLRISPKAEEEGSTFDDVDGVLLRGAVVVSTFAVQPGANGRFAATVTWDEVVDAGLGGKAGEAVGQTLTAQFIDGLGNVATQDLVLDLSCGSPTHSVCQGSCVAHDVTEHCGGCDQDCNGTIQALESDGFAYDWNGQAWCRAFDGGRGAQCGNLAAIFNQRMSCDDVCARVKFNGEPMRCFAGCLFTPEIYDFYTTGHSAGHAEFEGMRDGLAYATSRTYDDCAATPEQQFTESPFGEPVTYTFARIDCCCAAVF